MADIKQYHDISFPLSSDETNGVYFTLNDSSVDRLESDLIHVILTPRKTKIRRPDFGTNLIRHIFEPNDDETLDAVLDEVRSSVSKYVANANVVSIDVMENEDDNGKCLKITYTVGRGDSTETKITYVRL